MNLRKTLGFYKLLNEYYYGLAKYIKNLETKTMNNNSIKIS